MYVCYIKNSIDNNIKMYFTESKDLTPDLEEAARFFTFSDVLRFKNHEAHYNTIGQIHISWEH